MFLVVYEEDFAYATRPAPKKKPRPSIVEPILPGEYWARIRFGSQKGSDRRGMGSPMERGMHESLPDRGKRQR